MSNFNIGDRVNIYGCSYGGNSISTYYGEYEKPLDANGTCYVKLLNGALIVAHEKQLRKLKPKRKLREFWIVIRKDGYPLAFTSRLGFESIENVTEVVYVKEIRKK